MMKILNTILKKIQNVLNVISAAALIVMIAVIVVQTFARYVVHSSIPWSEELSRFLFVIIIMICFNIAISRDMLVNINILDTILKDGPILHALEIFRLLVGLFVEVFFFISSLQLIGIGWMQRSPAMQITMSWMYIFIAIGFGISILAVIAKIAEKLTCWKEEKK
jgi:TRAP-type C4-dicarboxylate transport system permease small subunit